MDSLTRQTLVRQIKLYWRCLALILTLVLVVFVSVRVIQTPVARAQVRLWLYGRTSTPAELGWASRTNKAASWESRRQPDEVEARNLAGLERMRKDHEDGSLKWDERAERVFMSRLEESQFPADCSKAHWFAKFDVDQGLVSHAHVYQQPLLLAVMRGHTLVQMSGLNEKAAFDGCGPNKADRNLRCYFNLTSCNPQDDWWRNSQIFANRLNRFKKTWDEILLQDDDFFSPGGVTVIWTSKWPLWGDEAYVSTSSFASTEEAYTYYKMDLWAEMGRQGEAVVVTNSSGRLMTKELQPHKEYQRVEMVFSALMSSWMLNQLHDYVKAVADRIMAPYMDHAGRPQYPSPVVAVHIRQTDKTQEDPYFREHHEYRPVADYLLHLKRMEDEFDFGWGSVFIISDSGTALKKFRTLLAGNASEGDPASQQDPKPYVMYDWVADTNLVERFKDHIHVPKELKHDMQTHFLATLYIAQKIADHALVTYSSNVGRLIGEVLSAKHRSAFIYEDGPFVSSLDHTWYWW